MDGHMKISDMSRDTQAPPLCCLLYGTKTEKRRKSRERASFLQKIVLCKNGLSGQVLHKITAGTHLE